MKFQILFSGKNKKNIINESSAKFAQRMVKFKGSLLHYTYTVNWNYSEHLYSHYEYASVG